MIIRLVEYADFSVSTAIVLWDMLMIIPNY